MIIFQNLNKGKNRWNIGKVTLVKFDHCYRKICGVSKDRKVFHPLINVLNDYQSDSRAEPRWTVNMNKKKGWITNAKWFITILLQNL